MSVEYLQRNGKPHNAAKNTCPKRHHRKNQRGETEATNGIQDHLKREHGLNKKKKSRRATK